MREVPIPCVIECRAESLFKECHFACVELSLRAEESSFALLSLSLSVLSVISEPLKYKVGVMPVVVEEPQ